MVSKHNWANIHHNFFLQIVFWNPTTKTLSLVVHIIILMRKWNLNRPKNAYLPNEKMSVKTQKAIYIFFEKSKRFYTWSHHIIFSNCFRQKKLYLQSWINTKMKKFLALQHILQNLKTNKIQKLFPHQENYIQFLKAC